MSGGLRALAWSETGPQNHFMPRSARAVLEGIAPFVAAGLLFGLLYNALFYPRTLVEYTEAGTIGVLLGAMVGVMEQHSRFKRWLQDRSFAQTLAIRTAVYSLAVAASLSLVLSVEPATLGQCGYAQCVARYVMSPLFARDLVFSTAFVFPTALLAHLVLLVGTRNFGRLVLGRYYRPREIQAEFMFADLRGSTPLAEALGNERYSSFLREFFIDISGPIGQARGEVYQYVGDEVVIVWPGARAAGRWLDCFRAMRGTIAGQRSRYVAKYGVAPEFKAGVHAGTVVATEVGTLQRAHAYHGDVLNTAARIQAKCNEAGFDLLASKEALASLTPDQRAGFEPLAPFSLRGKTGVVEVFGLSAARPVHGPVVVER
jgi:adenylate cyclase